MPVRSECSGDYWTEWTGVIEFGRACGQARSVLDPSIFRCAAKSSAPFFSLFLSLIGWCNPISCASAIPSQVPSARLRPPITFPAQDVHPLPRTTIHFSRPLHSVSPPPLPCSALLALSHRKFDQCLEASRHRQLTRDGCSDSGCHLSASHSLFDVRLLCLLPNFLTPRCASHCQTFILRRTSNHAFVGKDKDAGKEKNA